MKITITLLSVIIILLVVFFNDKITTLQNENTLTIQKYQKNKSDDKITPALKSINHKELESLNSQLIEAKNKIQKLEQKTNLNQAKKTVLKDEMQQNKQSKQTITSLKQTIDKNKIALDDVISSTDYKKMQKLESIVKVFKKKNKQIIQNNIKRITTLKEASGGILITGAIVPIIGAVTLIGYATQEIGNYCQNIKDNIDLEKKLFGKVTSLDEEIKRKYYNQCSVEP